MKKIGLISVYSIGIMLLIISTYDSEHFFVYNSTINAYGNYIANLFITAKTIGIINRLS